MIQVVDIILGMVFKYSGTRQIGKCWWITISSRLSGFPDFPGSLGFWFSPIFGVLKPFRHVKAIPNERLWWKGTNNVCFYSLIYAIPLSSILLRSSLYNLR